MRIANRGYGYSRRLGFMRSGIIVLAGVNGLVNNRDSVVTCGWVNDILALSLFG